MPNSLQLLIARMDEKVNQGDTKRESQRKVLTKLANELRPFIDAEFLQMRQATFFLLGAIIHRIYRLEAEYNSWNRFGSFWDVKSCGLYTLLIELLQLNNPKKRPLDEVTIATSLKVFRTNMLKEVPLETAKSKERVFGPRYKNYEHLLQDANFIEYLDTIIEEHSNSEKGKYQLPQFYAINFIESLAFRLETERKVFEIELNDWLVDLKKNVPFAQDCQEKIIESLEIYFEKKISLLPIPNKGNTKEKLEFDNKKLLLASRKKQIIDLLGEIDLEQIENFDKLLERVRALNINRNRCILCGGYAFFCHEDNEKIDPQLLHQMYTMLGLREDLTDTEHVGCINFLLKYVQNLPVSPLNYDYFDGRENMVSAILGLSTKLELARKAKEKKLIEGTIQEVSHSNAITSTFM